MSVLPLAGTLPVQSAAHSQAGPLPVARLQSIKSSPIRDLLDHAMQDGMISLAGGLPCPSLFDTEGMSAALAMTMRGAEQAMQYGPTAGDLSLRKAIAQLMADRQVRVNPEQLLVTAGSQQALDLVARLVLEPQDLVLVERPAYLAAITAFQLQTDHLEDVACDQEGPSPAALEAIVASGKRPRMIYLVPNFANPSGNTMSLRRRHEILAWAARHSVLIVEDDPYGELRFEGNALPSLCALARSAEHRESGIGEWVIHLSTLSKIVAPGLRLGWAIMPEGLMSGAIRLKQSMDLQTSTLMQHASRHYLTLGRLNSHVSTMRQEYRRRKQALRGALDQQLGDWLSVNDPAGGMFCWARLHKSSPVTASDWLPHALDAGVAFVPGENFFAATPDVHTLRLSFATTPVEQMPEAALRLRQSFEAACRSTTLRQQP